MFVPPTTMVVLNPLLEREKIFASFSICCASSRVGAMTMAIGPSPLRISLWFKQCWIIGMENAAVFPEPVSAHPSTSRPEQMIGMACAWMGVGFSYSWNLMSSMIFASRFMSSNDSIGGGASFSPGIISTITSMRRRISSTCSARRRFRQRRRDESFQTRVARKTARPVFSDTVQEKAPSDEEK